MRHEKKHTNKSHVTVPLIHCLDRFCIMNSCKNKNKPCFRNIEICNSPLSDMINDKYDKYDKYS